MSACVDIEIRRESGLTPKERALARDSFVRDFERRFSDWAEIARVCCEIERDRDWELLGFKSYHQWLVQAAPRSRSYIYLVTGRYKELSLDFSDEELAEIDLDSTKTLRQLSPAARRDPKIRAAAKRKPRELRQVVIETHPEQMIEDVEPRPLNFETSQAEVFDEALEAYRRFNNPKASAEEFVESMCADYLNSPWEDSGYTRKQRAAQLEVIE